MTLSDVQSQALPGVRIGRAAVGEDAPVYIVAEAGVNHDGKLGQALALVDAAADAGASAVKFQVFRAADLVTQSAPTAAYQQRAGSGNSQRRMLERLELTDADLVRVQARCAERGIEFLATPFGIDDVARIVRLGVAAIKIASTDLNNRPLLDVVIATGLPLILSTGAANAAEIRETLGWLRDAGAADRAVVLHCVSRYPTPLDAAHLRRIGALRDALGVCVGYSDHTDSTFIGGWAAAAGACLLEKHLTLDRAAIGPDHAMSLDPSEFAAYVANVRRIEPALGRRTLDMDASEAEVRKLARKSVVAKRALDAREVISADALTLKRPGDGIPPTEIDRLVGRRTRGPVPADTVLRWEMVE